MPTFTLVVKVLLVFLSSLAVIVLYVVLRNGALEVREDDYYRNIILPITWLIIFCVVYGMKIVVKNVIFGLKELEKRSIHLNASDYEKLLWGVVLDESDIKESKKKSAYFRLPVRDVIFPLALAIVSALMARSFEYSLFLREPLIGKDDAIGLGGCFDNKCDIVSNVFFSNMTKQILSKEYDRKNFVGQFSHAPEPNLILTPKWPPLDAKNISRSFAKDEYSIIDMSGVYGGVINRTCSTTYTDFGLIAQQSVDPGLPTYGKNPDEVVKLDRAYDILNDDRTVFLQTVLIYGDEISVRCNYTIEKAEMDVQWHYNTSGLTLKGAIKSGPIRFSDNATKWIDNYQDEENRLGLTIINSFKNQVQGEFRTAGLSKTEKIDILVAVSLAYAQTVLLRSSTKNDILNVRQNGVPITVLKYELRYRLKRFVVIVVVSLLCLIVLTGTWRAYRAGDEGEPVWGKFWAGLHRLGRFVEVYEPAQT